MTTRTDIYSRISVSIWRRLGKSCGFLLAFFACAVCLLSAPSYAKECTVWAVTELELTDETGEVTGSMESGVGYKAEVVDDTVYVNSGDISGYADHEYIMVDLSDYMQGETLFYIHYAVSAFATINGHCIDNYAGQKFYPYAKKADDTFYVPLLLPVAQRLRQAEDAALSLGYTLKIYDAYRPYSVTQKTHQLAEDFLNANPSYMSYITAPVNGTSYDLDWFLARTESRHNYGVAVDIALCDAETRKNELKQSQLLELSTKSIPDMSNNQSMLLREIMIKSGFDTLASEWWHFDIRSAKKARCDFQAGERNAF